MIDSLQLLFNILLLLEELSSNTALAVGRPEIINSDQGSYFTSPKYTELLLDNNSWISMNGKGRALDKYCYREILEND